MRCSADNGYLSEDNVARATARGIDVYIAPGRIQHGSRQRAAEAGFGLYSINAWMKAKLTTDEGHAIYARRKVIVEPVFGQTKNRGSRAFVLRGLAKSRGEFSLMGLSYNLLKLHLHRTTAMAA